MEAKTEFEVIAAFILLKAAIKVAEDKEDFIAVALLNRALPPLEFSFNLIKERQKPNIKRRNWIGGLIEGNNAIVDTPPFIANGEKILSKAEQERLFDLIK